MSKEGSLFVMTETATGLVMSVVLTWLLPYTSEWDSRASWKFPLGMVVFCVCWALLWVGLMALFRRYPMRLVPLMILSWGIWFWFSWQYFD